MEVHEIAKKLSGCKMGEPNLCTPSDWSFHVTLVQILNNMKTKVNKPKES